MANTDWRNQTSITNFILLGFGNVLELQILLFLVFLVIYIMTMSRNILIVVLVVADQHFHTPMYFFLGNLSCLETCYTSTILPRMLGSFLTGDRAIPFSGCITQYYSFVFLASTECYLLAAMSYDRCLAICKPLHYAALMNSRSCLWLTAESWISGFLSGIVSTLSMCQLIFCGPNEIDHFFCDFVPMMKLTCSDIHLMKVLASTLFLIFSLIPFLLTVTSYIYIILTILSIPSTTGRKKAFSTCSSHLIVVTLFYGTITVVYMFPATHRLKDLSKVFSDFFTVLTPMVNPLIYSLRNKEVKEAMRKALKKYITFQSSKIGVFLG
uniref:Olfactory receptor n=1 Tax=Terrapene triunguis TaxID=2587831 RepID=A0A674IZE4_9SAUR